MPNVGKSTLFNALTAAGAQEGNFPFCTIDPNVAVAAVPDPNLETIHRFIQTDKVIPASVKIVDIAGLVRGASKGEGLGNQFLGHIRTVDAILHVVRCFEDDDVHHVDGGVEPLRDIETIDTELIFADMDSVERRMNRYKKVAKSGDKDAKFHMSVAERMMALLEDGKAVRAGDWTDEELVSVKDAQLITSKPVLFVCNVDEGSAANGNAFSEKVFAKAAAEGAQAVVVSAAIESELVTMDMADRMEFLEEMGLHETGLARVIRAGYELLHLLTFFTVGPQEARAWTVHAGATAPEAAGEIHSDFQKGFIRAETIAYDDYVALGGEAKAREAGKLRAEGKAYVVHDGDVMHFLHS